MRHNSINQGLVGGQLPVRDGAEVKDARSSSSGVLNMRTVSKYDRSMNAAQTMFLVPKLDSAYKLGQKG